MSISVKTLEVVEVEAVLWLEALRRRTRRYYG